MTFPDYGALGIAGLVAATLAIILRVVWQAYQAALKDLSSYNATYTKLLVDLNVTLTRLTQVIEDSREHARRT